MKEINPFLLKADFEVLVLNITFKNSDAQEI